jgi:hypothetical protein
MSESGATLIDFLKSQTATSSSRHGGKRKLPFVFTEHGAIIEATRKLMSPPEILKRQVGFVVKDKGAKYKANLGCGKLEGELISLRRHYARGDREGRGR